MQDGGRPDGRLRALVPEVLRTEAQFRLLFAGQVLSLIGDRVMLVALPFAVLEAGGSIQAVGLVVAAQLVPFLVFALAGGVISDRGDRRRVLVASDLARLVVQAVGGILLVTGAATPLMLGVLAAFYGTADAFFQPAFTGLLPQTVSHPGQLQPANALRGLSFSVSSIAGPALAGVLIAGLGAGAAMLFDAGSFAVSVACLLRLAPRVAAEGIEEAPPAFLAAIRDGWREVRSRSWVLAGLGAMCAYAGIVLPAVYVLGPVTIADRLGGPGAWAVVVVSFGAGCVLGDLLLLRIRPRHALLTAGIALILASSQAAVYGAGVGLAATCALQFVAGIGVTAFFTLWEVSLQEHIPGDALSRVSSFDYLASTILMPVGTAVAGPLAASLGTQRTLLGMSAAGIASALAFLAVPGVRHLPRVETAAGTPTSSVPVGG
jgi:MFS family permease